MEGAKTSGGETLDFSVLMLNPKNKDKVLQLALDS
jgi:hypothetical protein